MAERITSRKTLNFTSIYKKITEQNKTISELAEEYNMPEDGFVKEMQMGLGAKVFPVAKKASERNERRRERQRKKEEKKAEQKVEQKAEQKVEQVKDDNPKSENSMESEPKAPEKAVLSKKEVSIALKKEAEAKKAFQELIDQEENAKIQIECSKKVIISSESVLKQKNQERENAKKTYEDAKAAYDLAKSKFDAVQKEVDELSSKINEAKEVRDMWEDRLSNVSQQILEVRNSKIYLIAPTYTGNIPKFGTMISCTDINGINVEIKKGEKLFNEPTFTSLLESGYNDLDEYLIAIEFAKLCILFELSGKEYTILLNDEKMKKVLEFQNIVI